MCKKIYLISFGLFLLISPITVGSDKKTYNILDFGAKPDGKTLCTQAVQNAIDKCAESGGGTVYFPAGTWLTGTVYLNGMIYIFGGIAGELDGPLTLVNDVWKYDISMEVWTLMKTCGVRPNSRLVNAAVAYNEKMYIVGGGGDLVGGSFNKYYDDVWEYDFTYSCIPWLMLLFSD